MGRTNMDRRRRLLFLTTSLDDTKPYMILAALIKGFQTHIGFAIIRASGEEWHAGNHQNSPVLPVGRSARKVN